MHSSQPPLLKLAKLGGFELMIAARQCSMKAIEFVQNASKAFLCFSAVIGHFFNANFSNADMKFA